MDIHFSFPSHAVHVLLGKPNNWYPGNTTYQSCIGCTVGTEGGSYEWHQS